MRTPRTPSLLRTRAMRPNDLMVCPVPLLVTQTLRPGTDVENADGWTASSGSDLYAMLDETIMDEADYVRSPVAPSADVLKLGLTDGEVPLAGIVSVTIRARLKV